MESSGSPGAWEKVLAPDSLYHPCGGFPLGVPRTTVRLEGTNFIPSFARRDRVLTELITAPERKFPASLAVKGDL